MSPQPHNRVQLDVGRTPCPRGTPFDKPGGPWGRVRCARLDVRERGLPTEGVLAFAGSEEAVQGRQGVGLADGLKTEYAERE
jgi:hypothetical protein